MKKTIALLLALVMCISLCACGSTPADDSEKLAINAYTNADGEAFIVNEKGEALQVPGGEKVAFAEMTADREHVVVQYENNDLSVFDSSMEQEVKIASDVSSIVAIRDSGVIYHLDQYAGLTVDEVLKSIVADYGKDLDSEKAEETEDAKDAEVADEAEDAEVADEAEDAEAADEADEAEDADADTAEVENDAAEKDKISVSSLKEELDEDADVEDAINLYRNVIGKYYKDVYQLSDSYVRYLFDGTEAVEIRAAERVIVADDNLNVIYTVDDTIYSMLETEAEGTKLATCKADFIAPIAISSVTGQAVWGDCESITISQKSSTPTYKYSKYFGFYSYYTTTYEYHYNVTYYTYSNNDTVKLFEASDLDSAAETEVYFTNNGSSFIMYDDASEDGKLYTWDAENGCTSHNTGGEIDSSLYIANGALTYENEAAVDGVYYETCSDDSYELYYLSFTGDREKIVSGLSYEGVQIFNGNLYYIDEDNVLYTASIAGAELGEKEKIASDVYDYKLMSDGKTVAYLKDYDSDDGGSLFIKSSGKDAEKIASDIKYFHCTDKNNLLVMKDTQAVSDSISAIYGELYLYNGGDELVKISSDVMLGSLAKYTTARGYDEDSLVFEKYDSSNDDGIVVSVMYYNGKETSSVLSDILY